MKKDIMQLICKSISASLAIILVASSLSISAYAEDNSTDPIIVVSLGDSYSSGEGIEPFYGQDKPFRDKAKDEDWLAHRSQKSWPSLLTIPGLEEGTTMSDYSEGRNSITSILSNKSSACEWYFKASSGAMVTHFNDEKQEKVVKQIGEQVGGYSETEHLPKQLDVFSGIKGTVDYVTLTVGGNDVDFSKLITECAMGSTYLKMPFLENSIKHLWGKFDETAANIKQVYVDIQNAAGSQATIIVAGYPKLLDKDGKGFVISKKEAELINKNVTKFNDEIEKIVKECQLSGMNIHFVDVEDEFDKDGGHQAYSDNAWINEIMLGSRSQDLNYEMPASAYSVHPNELGAQAYARCVNAKIKEIENKGTLSGRIYKASDRKTPINGATIYVFKNNKLYMSSNTYATGGYNMSLPAGDYRIKIEADGYIDFSADVSVKKGDNTYIETFLMIEEEQESEFEASTVFSKLPRVFSVRGSHWSNRFQIEDDGSFTGYYRVTRKFEQDEKYPNGTRYLCKYSGNFKNLKPVMNNAYSVQIDNLKFERPIGDTYYEDGIRDIYVEPEGIANGKEFWICLPGFSLDQLSWSPWFNGSYEIDNNKLGSDDYLFYNEKEQCPYAYHGSHKSDSENASTNAVKNSSKKDLSEYMGTDINDFCENFSDMYDMGATSGIEYSNGSITVDAEYESNCIRYISIDNDCEYSIFGIDYGMSFENAIALASESCDYSSEDLSNRKSFYMEDGSLLVIYTEDEKIVDGISYFIN